jgi:ribosomal protein S18 acetylase RimI-like enzyme
MSTAVTTWYLEQTSPGDLRPSAVPAPAAGVSVVRAEVPSPELGRFLYTAVGSDVAWTDRLPWPRERWREWLSGAGREIWVAYERGTPAGYVELDGQGGDRGTGVVEIAYFGLLPDFRGRGIGGHLLSLGTARAWDLAGRWPGRPPVERVWLHTCSLDGEHALANYRRRGFRVTHTTASH